jgi:hypothetical protein
MFRFLFSILRALPSLFVTNSHSALARIATNANTDSRFSIPLYETWRHDRSRAHEFVKTAATAVCHMV